MRESGRCGVEHVKLDVSPNEREEDDADKNVEPVRAEKFDVVGEELIRDDADDDDADDGVDGALRNYDGGLTRWTAHHLLME